MASISSKKESSPTPTSLHSSTSKASSPAPQLKTPKDHATNVFTNDGSFLERFKRMKQDEDEKKMKLDALERKQQLDERFKNRGKRKKAEIAEDPDSSESSLKKAKEDDSEQLDKNASAYLREMQQYNSRSVGDERTARPLVK